MQKQQKDLLKMKREMQKQQHQETEGIKDYWNPSQDRGMLKEQPMLKDQRIQKRER